VPSAPQNLAATAGNNQITLNWAAPASNGGASVTNYNVYKGTVAGAETLLATLGNVLSYTDNAVTNGQTYYYRVSAVNTVGESAKSNTIPATPAVPTAKTMTVAVTTNSPKYSWGSLGLLTVTVKDASSGAALAGASVAIKFSYPNGATAYTFTRTTDTTGTARAIFIVFYLVPVGTYSVTSTTSLSGYQTKTGQTTFNVVK
jgi:fibronectin type 3 domain-containing protein